MKNKKPLKKLKKIIGNPCNPDKLAHRIKKIIK